ncbi:MAG TPA: hypothetical protein VJ160_03815 [Anaerolineales bacterium]|nr:hypothetical protein [Anaerolineales bacterium]
MTIDPNRTVNVAVQVLPLAADPYPILERAIAVIQASGLRHKVDAIETVTPPPSVNSS